MIEGYLSPSIREHAFFQDLFIVNPPILLYDEAGIRNAVLYS